MIKAISRCVLWFLFWLFILTPLQLIGAIILLGYLPLHLWMKNGRLKLDRPINEQIKLPYFLRWFDNADIYVGRDYSVYYKVFESGYWNLYYWLAWRNPLNYFGYAVLGVEYDSSLKIIRDDPIDVGDATDCVPGLYVSEIEVKGKRYFEYYYIKTYMFRGETKCFRFRMGHKLQHPSMNKTGSYAQFVMVISPFHSYNGKYYLVT